MSRALSIALMAAAAVTFAGCHSTYAVRPIPRIAADSVGKPIGRLQEAFGQPRKIDTTPTKSVYVWFLPEKPAGAPAGFHGCEMEVTVYSLSNVGWGKCHEVERKIRVAER
jgi:hypothetical protein